MVLAHVVDAEAALRIFVEVDFDGLDVGHVLVEYCMVAPVVGIGGEARRDEPTETGNIDNVSLVGAFLQHERSAAVHGGIAHIEDFGAFLMVEQLDLVEKVDARHHLVHLHLGALRSQLLDDIVVTGHRYRHLDANLV